MSSMPMPSYLLGITMSTPYGSSPTCSSSHASSTSSCSASKAKAPSTPRPPARLTAATTSRQWLNAKIGNSILSRSQSSFFKIRLLRPRGWENPKYTECIEHVPHGQSRFSRCLSLAGKRGYCSRMAFVTDVFDPALYVAEIPHDRFRQLRHEAPVYFHTEPAG